MLKFGEPVFALGRTKRVREEKSRGGGKGRGKGKGLGGSTGLGGGFGQTEDARIIAQGGSPTSGWGADWNNSWSS